MGRGALLKEFDTGDVTLTLNNAGGEFSPEKIGSLLNGLRYIGKRVEVFAGLEIPDGTTEFVPQFAGRIQRLDLDSGRGEARLLVRGVLKQLAETKICKPTIDQWGTEEPNPLDVPDGFSASGTVTNPADAILRIATAAGITEADLDVPSFDAARSATGFMRLGATFGADGEVSALDAMKEFAKACLGTLYVNEAGKLVFYVFSYRADQPAPPTFAWDSNISEGGTKPQYDLANVYNKVVVRYGADLSLAYPPLGYTCEDADSIAAYGERLLTIDCRAIQYSVEAAWVAQVMLDAHKEPPMVVRLETDFDALPVQLTDTVLLTDEILGLSAVPMELLRKEADWGQVRCSLEMQKSWTNQTWAVCDVSLCDDGKVVL
jgi:hypothetical protein